ncbi:MAG: PAS domain S-box protein [Planctomycetes bacterium]|nr:PAS domain S-box protein [Planctomycetota bacterium]
MLSPFAGLRARLLLLVLAAVLPSLGVILASAEAHRRLAIDHALERARNLTRLSAAAYDQRVEAAHSLLDAIVRFPPLRTRDSEACSAFFRSLVADHPGYANIGAVDAAGDHFASARPIAGPVNASDRSWFRRALERGDFVVGNHQIGRITKVSSVNAAMPLRDPDGRLAAVLYIALDMAWLNQLAAQLELPPGASVTLFDRAETVVARQPDPERWLGKPMPPGDLRDALRSRLPRTVLGPGIDGISRFYSVAPLDDGPDSDLTIIVGLSRETILGEGDSIFRYGLLALGITTALALLAARFGGEAFIARPARTLAEAARRMSTGDFTARTGFSHLAGEIGALARAFDEMAGQLARRDEEVRALNAGLERRVEERTAALSEALGERDRFFDLSLDMLCVAGFDGFFKRVNPAFERTLGHTAGEMLAKPFLDFVHPDDRAATIAEMGKLNAGGSVLHFENRYECRDGSWKWVSWKSVPLLERGLIYAAARDVTEERRTAEEIRRLNGELAARAERLEEANRELEAFSYSVSHDLRAPLRHVDGYVHLFERHMASSLDEKGRRYLSTISDAALRMGRMIDDLLSFSRTGRAELRKSIVPLGPLVDEIVREATPEAEGRSIEWVISPLPGVKGDAALIRLALRNLVENAVKYTSRRERARIEIDAEERDGEVRVRVRDNGAGFDPRYAHKLFGVFERLHPREEFEGTGIGLANVRRIVERHGGRVGAEGRPGEGASFWFALPRNGP